VADEQSALHEKVNCCPIASNVRNKVLASENTRYDIAPSDDSPKTNEKEIDMNLEQMLVLAQDDQGAAAASAVAIFILLIELAILVLLLAGLWKCFTKAGKPGWAAIIPIYNYIVVLEIVGRPIWWIILLLIPCVNFFVFIILAMDFAKSYGKSEAFGIGLFLLSPIFVPILGFGDARYVGPAAAGRKI
jgi:uncharacterized membrane protein YhaH (DUF805 family)